MSKHQEFVRLVRESVGDTLIDYTISRNPVINHVTELFPDKQKELEDYYIHLVIESEHGCTTKFQMAVAQEDALLKIWKTDYEFGIKLMLTKLFAARMSTVGIPIAFTNFASVNDNEALFDEYHKSTEHATDLWLVIDHLGISLEAVEFILTAYSFMQCRSNQS